MEEEKVVVELPDLDETQIWDAPNDEVGLIHIFTTF